MWTLWRVSIEQYQDAPRRGAVIAEQDVAIFDEPTHATKGANFYRYPDYGRRITIHHDDAGAFYSALDKGREAGWVLLGCNDSPRISEDMSAEEIHALMDTHEWIERARCGPSNPCRGLTPSRTCLPAPL